MPVIQRERGRKYWLEEIDQVCGCRAAVQHEEEAIDAAQLGQDMCCMRNAETADLPVTKEFMQAF